MQPQDPLETAMLVARVLEAHDIPYFLSGSVASSEHGVPRTTQDADLVAELDRDHIQPLEEGLAEDFYIDASLIRQALRYRSSFNVIHTATAFKIDVFILRDEPFARAQMDRRVMLEVSKDPPYRLPFSSAEDVILQKLLWYKLGGSVSDQQWKDVMGIIKVRAPELDRLYLKKWADDLDIDELLHKVFVDAIGERFA